jgi:signal transduction histidine kinase
VLLAAGILAVEVFVAARARAGDGSIAAAIGELPPPAWIVLFAGSAVLVLRRRRPLIVLGVVVAAYVTWHLIGYADGPSLAILVATYGVGRYIADTRSSVLAVIAAAAVFVAIAIRDGDPTADVVLAGTAIPFLPWYIGRGVAARRERLTLLEERAELLERERTAELRQAIEEERRSIARELHDVVAHRVSLMTVQAGAAQAVLDDDPGRAAKAMSAVEDAGRAALDELRHLLDILGPRSGEQPRSPAASLADLPKLAEQMESAGLGVVLDVEGLPDDIPTRVDLSAFRIVQESLTNTLRHAGPGATATIRVAFDDGELSIEVVDDGVGESSWTGGSGRGLAGMRERAELLGGRFDAGPVGGGGFRVTADIPLRGTTR